jgi:competence protein ComFC
VEGQWTLVAGIIYSSCLANFNLCLMNTLNVRGVGDKFITVLKDIFFPAQCLGCGSEGEFVCKECFKTLDCSGVFCCPICHIETRGGGYCVACKQSYIDRHVAIAFYKESELVGKILHAFKYQYIEDIKNILEKIIKDFLDKYNVEVDIIIPVPLHKRRYVERGFNQSDIIAGIVGNMLDIPVENILKRDRHTKQQAKLKRNQRLENLKDAFILKKDVYVRGKKILLIDDVFTTGSTIQECAKVFKKAGVKEVVGFSVARG